MCVFVSSSFSFDSVISPLAHLHTHAFYDIAIQANELEYSVATGTVTFDASAQREERESESRVTIALERTPAHTAWIEKERAQMH